MGRSRVFAYRLEISGSTSQEWRTKERYGIPGYGKPTEANLLQHVKDYAKSLEIGGVNQHVSLSLGYIPYPIYARIVRQSDGHVVAEWRATAFQIW